ncbi:lipoprotein [Lysobacter enzymogenes]|uniref:Lipoprotein n=1 Tax=Lysobacter enzymogenes TaxID=69 RepID=A0A0S2DPZ1_LYSEN|nr:I78 family peptidase inhibitor [Lysobacter enzymogenes]ALN60795.1 lipoprotein [Lysobacter enzymogenes]
MNAERPAAARAAVRPRAPLLFAAALALAAGACAQNAPRPDLAGKGRCNADALGWAVGQTLDEATGRRLFEDSGAGLWRVVAPDNTFGHDRREDRLNVRVDQAQRIVAVDCG